MQVFPYAPGQMVLPSIYSEGEDHSETRAASIRISHFDPAPVALHDTKAHRQSQTCASRLRSEKRIEQFLGSYALNSRS